MFFQKKQNTTKTLKPPLGGTITESRVMVRIIIKTSHDMAFQNPGLKRQRKVKLGFLLIKT